MKQQNKYEWLFDRLLIMHDFELVKHSNGWRPVDRQAVVGNPNERFDNAKQIIDRLEIYIDDQLIDSAKEVLQHEFDIDASTFNRKELLDVANKYLTYDYGFTVDMLDMIVNHTDEINLENCKYKEEMSMKTYNCPRCGKQLVRLEPFEDGIYEFWCDDCDTDITISTNGDNDMKKYTLKDYKEFCKDALIMPPLDDDDDIDEWFDTHKIHIIANDCVMELDYDADAVNEIEFGLGEIHEAILGSGIATTGNTVGSEYRPAELKDIVRHFIMCRYENWGGLNWFDYAKQAVVEMCDIQSVIGVYESARKMAKDIGFECNWNNFKVETLKDVTEDGIKKIILDLVGSDIEISYDSSTDKSFIIDYTFKESGDFIDWSWGEIDEGLKNGLLAAYKATIFE